MYFFIRFVLKFNETTPKCSQFHIQRLNGVEYYHKLPLWLTNFRPDNFLFGDIVSNL